MQATLNCKQLLAIGALGVAVIAAPAFLTDAFAQNPHFAGEPTCVVNQAGDEVTCAGKIGGVGTEPTQVVIEIPGGCVNKPGQEPPGHVVNVTGPIQPRRGQISFEGSVLLGCPPGQTPVFGEEVTIIIIQDSEETFVGTVPIT
jgi:hypothetical protein